VGAGVAFVILFWRDKDLGIKKVTGCFLLYVDWSWMSFLTIATASSNVSQILLHVEKKCGKMSAFRCDCDNDLAPAYVHDPNTTMLIVLAAMFLVPLLIRRIRSRRMPDQGIQGGQEVESAGDI